MSRLKKITNNGNRMSSTVSMKMRLAASFPRKMAPFGIGLIFKFSRQSFCISTEKDLPRPMIPVKTKATQIIPEMNFLTAGGSMEKLKLKIRMTMSAKKNIEEIFSRLRISLTKSFQTIHRMALKNLIGRLQILHVDVL